MLVLRLRCQPTLPKDNQHDAIRTYYIVAEPADISVITRAIIVGPIAAN
jgi:hypothetical protein